MEQGFNKTAFMAYLENIFQGFEYSFVRELVENVIAYANKWERVSKDQFAYFVSDMLPEVEFGEVAAFLEDACLTAEGQRMKYEWINEHSDALPSGIITK